ncbi:hypothetical protein LCGC14_2658750, partial [marine sediment metagenome]
SHGPDEYVEVARLIECAEIYALTALKQLQRGRVMPSNYSSRGR